MDKLNISVVVPLYNEAESLPELAAWIDRVMRENGFSYELILVDDGSSDGSWEVVEGLKERYPAVRGISFARNYGKSAALYCGFAAAEGEVVITMDADLQDSPDEIPELRRMILEEGYDLVSGWKKKRHDPIGKRWPSKFFNWTARAASGIRLHDFNCGLKAYRRKVVKAIEVYGEMHRFIPFLAKQAGFGRIGEKVVDHRARKYGSSKFGLERPDHGAVYDAFRAFADVLLRQPRNADVPHGRRHDGVDHRREALEAEPRPAPAGGYGPAAVLSGDFGRNSRRSAVFGRIFGRADQQRVFRAEQIPDRQNFVNDDTTNPNALFADHCGAYGRDALFGAGVVCG